jgi:FkbM family methyltransferase
MVLLTLLCLYGFAQSAERYVFVENSEDMRKLAMRYLPSNPVIIEGGAYDGSETKIMSKLWPQGRIYSFEPIRELYHRVVEETKYCPNVTVYPLALGEVCEERPIYLAWVPEEPTKICMSSSLFPPKDHLLYYGPIFKGTQTIDMVSLDAWAEENGIEKIDLLWFDLQGYELAAFKGASKLISKVSVIMTEVEFSELYEQQPLYPEVRSWLEEEGFTLVGGDFRFPKDPNQHFGDALFVRKNHQ